MQIEKINDTNYCQKFKIKLLRFTTLKRIFFSLKICFYELYFLSQWTPPSIIDLIDGDTDFFVFRVFHGTKEVIECKSNGTRHVSENRAIQSRSCTKGVTASGGREEYVELSTSMEIWQKPWLMDELSAYVRPSHPSIRSFAVNRQ